MKRYFTYVALSAMVAALALSCSKEKSIAGEEVAPSAEETTNEGSSKDPADLSNLDPSVYLLGIGADFEGFTKAEFNLDAKKVEFAKGDFVLVYVPGTEPNSGKSGKYEWTGELFSPASEEDAIAIGTDEAFVYYPHSAFSVNEGSVQFTVPAAISAGSTVDLGNKTPMVGHIAAGAEKDADGRAQVTFKNLGAILQVGFSSPNDHGETITKVELTAGGSKYITGTGTVSWANDVPTLSDLSAGEKTIAIENIQDGHLVSGTDKVFYFFLPVNGDEALGTLSVKAIYGKKVGETTYEPYQTISRSSITPERSTIYSVSKQLSGFFHGGDGSETYPYIIASEEDFDNIYTNWDNNKEGENIGYNGTDTFFGHAHYKQTAETIDKAGDTYNVIGTSAKPFCGVYDGNNNTIANVSIYNGGAFGLFGYTSGAKIQNLTAENIRVDGTGANRGAFIGYMAGGEINNCHVTGDQSIINGNGAAIGGVVGSIRAAAGTVISCSSTANVSNTVETAQNYATGGIVGYIDSAGSKVSSCEIKGSVTGGNANRVGGIVGMSNKACDILSCSTTVGKDVTGNNNVGGIAGQIVEGVTVSGCTNNAAVSGVSSVGGLVGLMTNGAITTVKSVNNGSVTGTGGKVGGLVGEKVDGNIWTGATNNGNVEGVYHVGGLVGVQTAGATRVCVNTGDVTATGKSGVSGQDWANVGGIIGRMDGGELGRVNGGYTAENTGTVTATSGNGCGGVVGVMTAGTIAYSHATAAINGLHHVGGIVGILRGGAVRNCYNVADVICTGNHIGGIVGNMQAGTVDACYTTYGKTIKGTYNIGGIVGGMSTSVGAAVVINCAARSTVNATYSSGDQTYGVAGGIVGEIKSTGTNRAVIANCVALAAKVFGAANNQPCGAVVGMINADNKGYSIVDNCYSQANTNAFIGYSTDGGSTVKNCTSYSGGVYGYLKKGMVMDCYYTNGGSSHPKAGTVTTTSDDVITRGGPNGVTQIANGVKNGTSPISVSEYHYLSDGSISTVSIKTNDYYLYKVMDIGTYMADPKDTSVKQTYESSVGVETCSAWTQIESSSTYIIAYPQTLYDLGANYRP